MTTNTIPSTASQAPAVSIDTPEFRNLLQDARAEPESNAKQSRLIAHIDAKLAQAREEAIGALAIAFEKMLCAAVGRDRSTSGISASSLVEELRSRAEKAEARATAAEAKLKAIRQGVECSHETLECLGDIFSNTERPDKITVRIDNVTNSLHVHYEDLDEEWLREVKEAIGTTTPKADESGLPG